ncbi:MAG: hypothetical protein U1E65_17875 [Myxococcota bacterium]
MRAPLLAAVTLSLLTTAASAYVLPTEAILGSVARRREGATFKSLVVEGVRKHTEPDGEDIKVWEAVLPGVGHRVELRASSGTTVILTLGTKRWVFKEGEKAGSTKIKPSLILSFLGDVTAGGGEGREFIHAYGIDPEVVTLSRIDKVIAFVIGAHAWETNKPQLWIDKGYRVPTRFIEVDPKTSEITDTRLTGYGSPQTGEWWPRKIEVYKGGKLVESTIYDDARVNEPVESSLFKPPAP